jgi:hypothetical protein
MKCSKQFSETNNPKPMPIVGFRCIYVLYEVEIFLGEHVDSILAKCPKIMFIRISFHNNFGRGSNDQMDGLKGHWSDQGSW